MADATIVSCPGCGKRYSVPAGSPPGQFQCQDCSAVVVYGRGEPPPAAHGKGHGTSARTHAKAAAAKRKLARSRRDEAEDEDDRPAHGHGDPKKKDSTVYVMGIVGVLVFAVAAVVLVKNSGGNAPKAPAGGGGVAEVPAKAPPSPAPVEEPEAPVPDPVARPKPAPRPEPADPGESPKPSGGMKAAVRGGVEEKPDNYTPAAQPPSGGHYGKSQAALILLLKDSRADVWIDPGHLPDTPSDLAQKIDADVLKMADVNGGAEGFKAQDRLIKIGRPAIPKVLGLVSKLDFSKYSSVLEARDACILGDAIDHVLREITGYDKVRMLQYSPQNGKITEYMESLDGWCLWWYTIGYKRETFYKAAGAPEDEKL